MTLGEHVASGLDSAEILDRFVGWVADRGLTPYPEQEEAILELLADRHVVLSTPTGSGKSLVALALHFRALCAGDRSFYCAPVKALVSEKFFALCDDYRRPFVDGVTDELMPIGFLTPQRHKHGVPLYSPRVIRDAFHRAIN